MMGRQLVRVPLGFRHPTDAAGEPIPGAHLEPLWVIPDGERTAYQIYENVSEGTPVSPVFNSGDELRRWLVGQGVSAEVTESLLRDGSVPGFVFSLRDGIQDDVTDSAPRPGHL
jgi:hypothetical protein